MSALDDIYERIGGTRAIFVKGSLEGSELTLTPKYPYDIDKADIDHDDPLVKLVKRHHSERFDKYQNKYHKSHSSYVYGDMFRAVATALINASPLKNPNQSKVYKWFREHGEEHKDAMILLYRYVAANTDTDFRFDNKSNNPHAKNLLAIIEKMKDKYER